MPLAAVRFYRGDAVVTVDTQTLVAIVVPAVVGLGWLFRLEARITRADERHNDLKDDIAEIKADMKTIRKFMGGDVVER